MPVDLVLRNATVLTGPDFVPVGAVAVDGGRIVALGDDADGLDATRSADLGGATVSPGFHDAHMHVAWFGSTLGELDLGARSVGSVDELCAAVAARASTQPRGTWVVGFGYDQNKLRGGHPTAAQLDRAAPEHPVIIRHTSGHMCVVNSVVLAQLDLDHVPPGGDVVRGPDGTPTGLLREQAQNLLRPLRFPTPFTDVVDAIGRASDHLLSEGVTSVQDAGVGGGWIGHTPLELAAYQQARADGRLGVRASVMPTIDVLHDIATARADVADLGLDLGIRSGFGDDRLRIGPVKIFADGSLVGRTAAMREDFAGLPGERGYFQTEPADLRSLIARAHRAGWQIATHAIGDLAVGEVVDAYAAALAEHPRADHRHRIEHCAVSSEQDVQRIAELGIVPVPQGRFVNELGDGMRDALGPDRVAWCYRMRSFLDAGIVVPGSSDRPVVDGAPLLGLADLVARRTSSGAQFAPHERVSPADALRAHTYGSAYAAFAEDRLGTIEVGKLADLVVLSQNPLTVDERTGVDVLATLVDGVAAFDPHGLC